MKRPMRDMLEAASGRISLHMPGGQGTAPFESWPPYALDTTELALTDDLYRPTGAIMEAQALAARSAGAAHTLMLHGGSTAGIHTMLLYAAEKGQQVILPRNAHISALNMCAIAELEPVFVEPLYSPKGRPYTPVESYTRAMDQHPRAKAVLVVRPDYYGTLADMSAIAAQAHRRGMQVLCDEAHGAHFNWFSPVQSALACGADMAVQSAHKTLPALTGAAWLHAGERVDALRLRRMLRLVQTSSPSFLLMLALDDARAWMDEHGAEACEALAQSLEEFYEKAEALGYSRGQEGPHSYDPLRLTLEAPQGGYALEAALSRQGIDVEMADVSCIVAILSLMDGPERLEKLYAALERIGPVCAQRGSASPGLAGSSSGLASPTLELGLPPTGMPKRMVSLRKATFAPSVAVSMEKAVGRISGTQVGLYPPGVALLTAGERITEDIIRYLSKLDPERVFGLPEAGKLLCL